MTTGRNLLPLTLALFLVGCAEAAPRQVEVRPVQTVVVDPKPVDDDRRAVGDIRPRYESDIGFRIAGKVVLRAVDIGATVMKGDLLAQLDTQDYRNKLKSADADIAAAQAVLTEAAATEARLRHLLGNGHTTRANYDVALKNLRSAEAKLDAAKTALEMAKDQLSYAELRADFDGIVTAVGAEPGQIVNVGQMVVRLARPDERDAVFSIAESAFADKKGDARHLEIVVALLSNSGVTADGVVREISPVADAATRTFQVKVTLKDPPLQMRFGASVAGRVKTSTTPVVMLPGSALFDKVGQPAVWIVDPATSLVRLQPVTVLRYETDRVVVGSGLSKGDIVVVAGVNRLRENQKVRVVEGGAS